MNEYRSGFLSRYVDRTCPVLSCVLDPMTTTGYRTDDDYDYFALYYKFVLTYLVHKSKSIIICTAAIIVY